MSPAPQTTFGLPDEALWQAAVGKNSAYYLRRFSRMLETGPRWIGWHWPALFVPFVWAIYRKLWGAAILFFFLPYIAMLFVAVALALVGPMNDTGNTIVYGIYVVTIFVVPPLVVNALYFRKVRARVASAMQQFSDTPAQVAFLTGSGGTSGAAAVVVVMFGSVFIIGVLAAIAIPQYQDYVGRSRISASLAAVDGLKQQVDVAWTAHGAFPETLDLEPLRNRANADSIGALVYDKSTGTISITMAGGGTRMDGKKISLVPRGRANEPLTWSCRNVDVPNPLLPRSCRTPAP